MPVASNIPAHTVADPSKLPLLGRGDRLRVPKPRLSAIIYDDQAEQASKLLMAICRDFAPDGARVSAP
jgi:hypothetical protein